jgi:hypothetical protein
VPEELFPWAQRDNLGLAFLREMKLVRQKQPCPVPKPGSPPQPTSLRTKALAS